MIYKNFVVLCAVQNFYELLVWFLLFVEKFFERKKPCVPCLFIFSFIHLFIFIYFHYFFYSFQTNPEYISPCLMRDNIQIFRHSMELCLVSVPVVFFVSMKVCLVSVSVVFFVSMKLTRSSKKTENQQRL